VLDERRRTLGPDDPRTVSALSDVALVLAREATATPAPGQAETPQGRQERERELDESERLHREVLAARERLLGPAHADTLLTANNLAWLFLKRGRPDEAAPLAERARDGAAKASGDDDRMSMLYANTLGLVLAAQGRYDEAERLHTANLVRRRRVLGEGHPDTLASMSNLARVYAAQGRRDEAITLWDQVVETRRARQKPGEPEDHDLAAAIKERDDLIASH
jgi:tetratricopeptide (TPR) repeat protein